MECCVTLVVDFDSVKRLQRSHLGDNRADVVGAARQVVTSAQKIGSALTDPHSDRLAHRRFLAVARDGVVFREALASGGITLTIGSLLSRKRMVPYSIQWSKSQT
jgi:hypothetical protein